MQEQNQIEEYIDTLPEGKSKDMLALHSLIMKIKPGCKLWFLDGKNGKNKMVSNPNIGYGVFTIKYADGKEREFYKVGMSANTSGISVYIMSIADKKYLANTYADTIGKASVSGYCIKFKKLKDVNIDVLKAAILDGFKSTD